MNLLLEKLINASDQGSSFHILFTMVNERAEEERMREAKELESTGFIVLTRCDRNDFMNNMPVVTLKGTLTQKTLDLKGKRSS